MLRIATPNQKASSERGGTVRVAPGACGAALVHAALAALRCAVYLAAAGEKEAKQCTAGKSPVRSL